jgi:hypothetical protein
MEPDLPDWLFSITMFETGHVVIAGSTDLPPAELPVILRDLADQLESGAVVLVSSQVIPFDPN